MVAAMVQAAPGDTIEFACGYYELTSSLQLTNTEDVLIKGCGRDKTVLSFKNNNAPEGILAVNVHGFTVQDLTVLDTGAHGLELDRKRAVYGKSVTERVDFGGRRII